MICFSLFEHWARRAASRAVCTAGSKSATPTPASAGEVTPGNESRRVSDIPSPSTTRAADEGNSRARQLGLGGDQGRVDLQERGRVGPGHRGVEGLEPSSGRAANTGGRLSCGSLTLSRIMSFGSLLVIAA